MRSHVSCAPRKFHRKRRTPGWIFLLLSLVFLFPACTNWRATTKAAETAQVIRPKVVIVVYFEVGKDTGDMPGELQFWVERDHLDRVIDVPGMSRSVRANRDGSEIAVAVGPGNIRPGVNLMALGMGSQFDLRKSYWLLNGIAGISPTDGTVGSAVWTDFVVNGDLAKEIDPRETPTGWPRKHPEDAFGIELVTRFRSCVAEEFNRLLEPDHKGIITLK